MAGTWNLAGLNGDGDFAYADGDVPAYGTAVGRWQPARIEQAIIAGGVAGNHTVTGVKVGDVLIAVTRYIGAGVVVTDVTDLTSEFTITADNTINNGGGTNTTGDKLQVWWIDRVA